MKVSKNQYLKGFCLAVIALGVIRAVFPNVAMTEKERQKADSIRVVEDSIRMATELAQGTASEPTKTIVSASKSTSESAKKDASAQETTGKTAQTEKEPTKSAVVSTKKSQGSRFFNADGTESRRRILSVSSYSEAFPDAQDVQILSANKWGVSPVLNRHEAEERKAELVYVGSNPYFFVEPLNQSIPYLVPHALVLLQDIGRNFLDSLQVKGLKSHKIIETSV
ncbi:MAG: hypothetical protein IKV37_05220, partial [Prevotella sp.]|nr:hypothetical protein [Prevotella sp.]